MTSSIGGLGSSSALYEKLFKKLDSDNSGSVSRDEFVSGAPQDISSEKAGALFDKLDSSAAGSLSKTDLASAFEKMSSDMQATMIQVQADSTSGASGSSGSSSMQGGKPPSAAEMFSKMDTNGDGSVTRDEFVSGRPDDLSESNANSMFDQISGGNSDSFTEETLAASMQAPPPPPPPSDSSTTTASDSSSDSSSSTSNSSKIFDKLDTNKDGTVSLDEFLAGRPDQVSEQQATDMFSKISNGSDSITEQQFADSQPPAPPGSSSSSQTASSTANEMLKQLLSALSSDSTSSSSNSSSTSTSSTSPLDQLMAAIDGYTSSNHTAVSAAKSSVSA